jgi:dihydrofolate reductase
VKISLIAAMDEKRGIGFKGKLPWRLSTDLKRFRELTMGRHIIIGRKTFDAIGKPLPGRDIIVITRDSSFQAEGCLVVNSLEEAIELARSRGESEVFVCGGAEIYEQALGKADTLYLTFVHTEVEADVRFPEWDQTAWVEIQHSEHPAGEKDDYATTFSVMEAAS